MKKLSVLSVFCVFLAILFLTQVPVVSANFKNECGRYIRDYREIETKIKALHKERKENVSKGGHAASGDIKKEIRARITQIKDEISSLVDQAKAIRDSFVDCVEDYKKGNSLRPGEKNAVKKAKGRMDSVIRSLAE